MKNRSPIFVLFITIFIDLLGFGLIIPILPIFAKELHASSFQIGLIAAIYSLMTFLFAPFWGTLSDKIGRRPVMLISIFLTMLSYIFFAFTHDLLFLVVSRIFSGIGAANISAAQAYIADITEPKDRAKNMGLIGAAFGLGFIFGPPVGGYLKSLSGPGSVDLIGYFAASLCAFNLIMAYSFLPESLKIKQTQKKFRFKPISDLFKELQKPIISELFFINFIFIAAFSMMQITAAILWVEHYLLDEKQIGFVFMFMGISSAVVQGGLIGKLTKTFGEKSLLLIGSVLMAIGLGSMPFVPVDLFFLQMISILLIALANGCMMPSITSLISQYSPKNEQGQVLGMNQSFGSLARVIGPILGGFLYSLNFVWPYVGGAILMISSYFIASLLLKKHAHTLKTN
ncbi:MAG: MFS transporter [Bacteroidia bacterium]|nr:MFS transporter [Bacteroidia bacterium]MCF8426433.1 MFS transporter [Bacteroidia bacterium]MCF8446202.1 MFS transporter [Bacteroidia bacterium]